MAELGEKTSPRLGPYQLGERLGAGGMAEVFVARRAGPHGFVKRFAIKRILPQLAKDSHFVSMFCDEARICAALAHPNIVQVVDFGEEDGELFMAMEYVEGVSCAKLLRTVASRGGRVPLGASLFIAHEVLRALAYAHTARDDSGRPLGIVHRDVSPGNVLLGRAGEVKLTDFGIVRSEFVDRRTNPGELKGKIGYMSPEQALGHELDPRSDLFAVGIILAEMLLARPLFPGRTELEILSRIHDADLGVLERHAQGLRPDLVRLLRRALAKLPAARIDSADEFANELRQIADRAGVELSDGALAGWLAELGIMPMQSGTRLAVRERGHSLPAELRALPSEQPTEPAHVPSSDERYRLEHTPLGARELLGAADLAELLATGRIRPEARVLEAGHPARAVRELAGLGHVVAEPAYAFGFLPGRAQRALLVPQTLAAWLYALVSERATGLVVARDGAREKRIYLRGGAPVLVASTSREELLGRRLVAAGLVRAEQMSVALTDAAEGGTHLGVTLVERALLRPLELMRALLSQLDARVTELGSWTGGELAFAAGERPHHEAAPPARTPGAWVTRMVRERVTARSIERALAPTGPFARNPAARLSADDLGLTADEARVLQAAPGARSLAEVSRRPELAGESAEQLQRGLFIGLSAGILVAPGWSRR